MTKLVTLLVGAALLATQPAYSNYSDGSVDDNQPIDQPPQEDTQQQLPPGTYGWVYAPYTTCVAPNPACVVDVPADGLNLRQEPNGLPTASLVNGTPLTVYGAHDGWLMVRIECELSPVWAWSITANVPLLACMGSQ